MRIIFIRHGDPDYEHDSLTEKGWREAALLAERVSAWRVTDFYVSLVESLQTEYQCARAHHVKTEFRIVHTGYAVGNVSVPESESVLLELIRNLHELVELSHVVFIACKSKVRKNTFNLEARERENLSQLLHIVCSQTMEPRVHLQVYAGFHAPAFGKGAEELCLSEAENRLSYTVFHYPVQQSVRSVSEYEERIVIAGGSQFKSLCKSRNCQINGSFLV